MPAKLKLYELLYKNLMTDEVFEIRQEGCSEDAAIQNTEKIVNNLYKTPRVKFIRIREIPRKVIK
jgi:hypothetical protein